MHPVSVKTSFSPATQDRIVYQRRHLGSTIELVDEIGASIGKRTCRNAMNNLRTGRRPPRRLQALGREMDTQPAIPRQKQTLSGIKMAPQTILGKSKKES